MRVVILGLVSLLGLVSCSEQEELPARIVDISADEASERGERVVIAITDSNWTKVVVRVGRAERQDDSLQTMLYGGVEAEFLDRDGRINALLTADSARIDDNSGNMCATGLVVVYSPRNRTRVETVRLCYEKEEGMLRSEQRVVVDDSLRGRHIEGTGFESDESLGVYTFFNVTGRARSIDR